MTDMVRGRPLLALRRDEDRHRQGGEIPLRLLLQATERSDEVGLDVRLTGLEQGPLLYLS